MNTGQSLFSIGALLLLSLTVLRVNNNILLTDEVLYDSKFGIIANSIATSIIEKATTKFFDENTATGPVPNTLALTLNLRTESGDEINPDTFDDFDDFNTYSSKDTFFTNLVFSYRCEVCYVNTSNYNLDIPSTVRTWHKKLTVFVTWDQNGKQTGIAADTIKQSVIYSYWFF